MRLACQSDDAGPRRFAAPVTSKGVVAADADAFENSNSCASIAASTTRGIDCFCDGELLAATSLKRSTPRVVRQTEPRYG